MRGNKRWKRETHKRKKKIQTPRPISSRRKRVNRKRAGRKGSFKKIKWRRKQEGGITTNTKERKKERKIASKQARKRERERKRESERKGQQEITQERKNE